MNLLITVDNKKRDLLGLVYLAQKLFDREIRPVLVPWNITLDVLQNLISTFRIDGILIGQARATTESFILMCRNKGLKVYIHESEGWPYKRNIGSFINSSSDKILRTCDAYFSWGEKQIQFLKDKGSKRDESLSHFINTGSIRLEAINYAKDKWCKLEEKKQKIVFALSCAIVYPKFNTPANELMLHVNNLGYTLDDYLKVYNSQIKNQERLLAIAQTISRGNRNAIEIRPHPFASEEELKFAMKNHGLSKCRIQDNQVFQAIKDTSLVIHGGSTMCLEATYGNVRSITSPSIGGYSDNQKDHEEFTTNVENLSDVSTEALKLLNNKASPIKIQSTEWLRNSQYTQELPPSKIIVDKISKDSMHYFKSSEIKRGNLFITHDAKNDVSKKYRNSKFFNQEDIDDCYNEIKICNSMERISVLYFDEKFRIPVATIWRK